MIMTDFSVPQRMSLSAFFIYFLKFFRLTLNASIIFLAYEIFKSDSGFIGILLKIAAMIGCAAVLALILASMAFFKIKFYVEDGNLIYRHHLISSEVTTIPLNRIHTLRTRQGLLYRLLNLRGILFDTLAAKGEEIELILSEPDWQNLIGRIERQKQQPANPDIPPVFNPTSFKKFSNKDLVLDALCQNHLKGMVVLGGFIAIIFNFLSDLSENAIHKIASYIESHLDLFSVSTAGTVIIMASAYMVSLMLWLGKVLLRYSDLTLSYNNKTLIFTHGLFSRFTSRFSHDKICSVWIKRNYFEKRFKLCTLTLKQALNASAQKEDDNLKIYGKDCSVFFLDWWLGQGYGSEADLYTAKSGKGVIIHSLLPDLILSSVTTAVLWYFELYSWITIPAIYLLASIPKGIMAMRHSHISLKESYLIISNGRFAEIKNYLKYHNVEVLRITRTPLSRVTGRVSLTLSTPGSTFTIRSLRQENVLPIYELLLAKSQWASDLETV